MTAARIRAQFPTSDGFGYQLKGCCRHPFVWASYNISRYIGRHSSRENNTPVGRTTYPIVPTIPVPTRSNNPVPKSSSNPFHVRIGYVSHWFQSNQCSPSARRQLSFCACISSRITTVIHVVSYVGDRQATQATPHEQRDEETNVVPSALFTLLFTLPRHFRVGHDCVARGKNICRVSF